MAKVKVYSTSYCPFCTKAKQLLSERGADFEEIDLTEDTRAREEVQNRTGWSTVPMIFIGDEFVGGYQDLAALDASGELEKKLKS